MVKNFPWKSFWKCKVPKKVAFFVENSFRLVPHAYWWVRDKEDYHL